MNINYLTMIETIEAMTKHMSVKDFLIFLEMNGVDIDTMLYVYSLEYSKLPETVAGLICYVCGRGLTELTELHVEGFNERFREVANDPESYGLRLQKKFNNYS